MTPYYQDDAVVIYHGDCRDVMAGLYADAVITDPPYGIDFQYATHKDDAEGWFSLMTSVVPLARSCAPVVVMPSCKIDRLEWWYNTIPPDWIICWFKGSPGHQSGVGFNAWEPHLVWGRPKKAMHDHFATRCGFDANGHPCPKPLEWALWLVSRIVPDAGTIIDPFMGSGTTLRAAKDLGRKAIGIEIEERYCEIAAKRMRQEVLF